MVWNMMRALVLLIAGLLVSCNGSQRHASGDLGKARDAATKNIQKRNAKLLQMVEGSDSLLGSLKSLNDEQRAAVSTAIILTREITAIEASGARFDKKIGEKYMVVIEKYCPDLPRTSFSRGIPCFDQTVAYLSALKDCEEDNKTESECLEAQVAGSSLAACQFDALLERIGLIRKMFRRTGPRPLPIPYRDGSRN